MYCMVTLLATVMFLYIEGTVIVRYLVNGDNIASTAAA